MLLKLYIYLQRSKFYYDEAMFGLFQIHYAMPLKIP